MDSDSLRNLLRILEDGTITGAAKRSGKTQPALTRQMQLLEDEVGVRLFERAGRGVAATAAGRAVGDAAASILRQWEDTVSRARAAAGREVQSLRLAASVTTCLYLLPGILARYRDRYPDRPLSLQNAHSSEIMEWMRRGEVDLGIVAVTEPPQEFEFIAYRTVRLGILSQAGRPDAPQRYEDLAGEDFVFPRRGLVGELIRTLTERSGVTPNIVAEADNLEVVKALVRGGFGVSVVPDLCLSDEAEAGGLQWQPLPEGTPLIRIGSILLKARYLRKAVLDFLDVLGEGGL